MTDQTDQVRAGTGRNATTLELFFDLVYVFAITEVVVFVHNDPTLVGLLKGAFLLFLLWWTWSIYTWTTNWCGTGSASIRLYLLAAMGATLVMGIAVPNALGDASLLFAATYFTVRVLVAGLYWFESKEYPIQRAAFWTFYPLSLTGALVVLIGGFFEGATLMALFALGGAIDLFGALNAGRGAWAVDASHFAERNGLFIIIALGESVVGLGLAASSVELDVSHVSALMISFAGIAALWWAYFDHAAPKAEREFTRLTGRDRGRFARDVYTLLHYPLVVGIVMFAIGLGEVVTHPSGRLGVVGRVAVAGGLALALAAVASWTYRALRHVTVERLLATLVLVLAIPLGAGLDASLFAAACVAVIVLALVAETARARRGSPAGPRGA